jgi:hypothetical protein
MLMAPGDEKPKRYGTLIRVSDEFAEAINRATRMMGLSVSAFADDHLLPIVEERYRESVLAEADRVRDPKPSKPGAKRPKT